MDQQDWPIDGSGGWMPGWDDKGDGDADETAYTDINQLGEGRMGCPGIGK